MQIGEISGFNFDISALKKTATDIEEGLTDVSKSSVAKVETAPSAEPSTMNMMAGSFVKTTHEDSRYIKGLMTSYKVENEFRTKFQSIVNVYSLEAALADGDYAKLNLAGQKAERAAKKKAQDLAGEKMEEKLKESRKEDDKKLDEKLAEKTGSSDLTQEASSADVGKEIDKKNEAAVEATNADGQKSADSKKSEDEDIALQEAKNKEEQGVSVAKYHVDVVI